MPIPNGLDPSVNRIRVGAESLGGAGPVILGGYGTAVASHSSIAEEVGTSVPIGSLYLSSRGSGSVWVLMDHSGGLYLWTQLTIN